MTTCTYDQIRKFVRRADPLDYIRGSENEDYTIHWCAGTGEVPSSAGYYIIIRVTFNPDSMSDALSLDFAYWDEDTNTWWLNTNNSGFWADRAIPLAYVEDEEEVVLYEGMDE